MTEQNGKQSDKGEQQAEHSAKNNVKNNLKNYTKQLATLGTLQNTIILNIQREIEKI